MADQQFGACGAPRGENDRPPLTIDVRGIIHGTPEYLATKFARYEHVTSDPAAVVALKRKCAACGHERGQHANGLAGVCDPFCYTCRDNGNECKCFTLTAGL